MEPVYIVMICSAVLFVILLSAYFVYADFQKRNNMRKEEELEKVYSDKNLAKMEYDVAVYDEETRKLMTPRSTYQVTMDEVIQKDEKEPTEDVNFGKMESEGVEQITGNFKGD